MPTTLDPTSLDMDNASHALLNDDARGARWTLRVAMIGMIALGYWAWSSKIDQVTRAPAQIIASARTQVIQASELGVLTALSVKEGDHVKTGQVLATFEKARAQAAVDETKAKAAALRIALTRLRAEVYGQPLTFSPDLLAYKDYIRNQTDLYQKRHRAIEEDVASLQKARQLALTELEMNQSLEKTGDVSRADLLKLQRQVADIEAQMVNKRNKYFQDAQADMTKAQEDLQTVTEQMNDRSQVLEHTELSAPVNAVVKDIRIVTLGASVRPGDVVMELLPEGGDLVVEAKVSPTDIAFVEKGQMASVKLDAYDYSIFGSMKGEVIYISPDTLKEEQPRPGMPSSTYYRVHIRIGAQEIEQSKSGTRIQIRPGMTAQVDIKAQERSVLSYLIKPVAKTLSQSMGER